MANKKGGLGRGLDALFADVAPIYREEETAAETPEITDAKKPQKKETKESTGTKPIAGRSDATEGDSVVYIDINDIKPNVAQPRKYFDEEALAGLSASIKELGVIQPLIVRTSGSGYELVAGERRWRAARMADLREVPCIIRDFDEQENMIVAIVENMQREDLDPIEEAEGLQQMISKYGFTQDQVSKTLGKSRAYIANSVRLLKLPDDIKSMVSDGRLSAAHGRTLVTVDDPKVQIAIADRIAKEDLSVRATERLADKAKDDSRPERKKRRRAKPAETAAVEDELRELLGTKVNIVENGSTGRVEIEYYSLEELNRIIDMLRSIE